MRRFLLTVPAVACLAAGCGGATATTTIGMALKPEARSYRSQADEARTPEAMAAQQLPPVAGGAKPAAAVPAPEAAVPRKVVHTATIELIVKEMAATEAGVERVIDETKGYISKADLSGTAGSRKTAVWTLKVPVEAYRPALAKLSALGTVVKSTADSQDVTEEFADSAAKVKSLKAEEETLQRLMKDAAARLEDILKIRDQIKTVRLDIDRAEGRMVFLASTAALSTITLTAKEIEAFVPVAVAAAAEPPPPPAFGETVAGTFERSVGVLTDVGKAVVIGAVAAAPWLPLLAIAVLLARLAVRRLA